MAECNERWMNSEELWLQRLALIFQLKYGSKTNEEILISNILRLMSHPNFFIRKGIGWALRQYAKTNPDFVRRFVETQPLSNLSSKEALKHL
jgi:3-methyladenine DNA glycosylase AlkD